ncbi:pyridoxamine 5'-phosphate oxidase family protein [Iamia majanohamensis]|uniref:Pyridoxamine 5'-phosphate oxidase family protein n=1 Tax=Iamia majanohamensis TaxID=467976 RepID=A0AAE9Y4R9_9ACTN|nr:pyridoxamine 5'-phosphate oxidase family protein [Iamia majanohamensis]WCO66545.1 pyridoxamine 5'-phosphate oxidase family protein [Iamia majanohamensis]
MDARDTTLDRLGLEVLSPQECWDLLAAAPVGRLAFVDGGAPMVLPVTHRVVGRRVVFRSPAGGKLSAAVVAAPVAFEVDEWDADGRTGWSVVARGVAESSPDDVAALEGLGLDPWLDEARRATWVQVRVDEVTGRRLGPAGA